MGTLDKASEAEVGTETSTVSEREQARKRLQTQRDFASHVVAYVVINAFLVGIWAFTGAGYFWPAWVLGAWGPALCSTPGTPSCAGRSPRRTSTPRSSAITTDVVGPSHPHTNRIALPSSSELGANISGPRAGSCSPHGVASIAVLPGGDLPAQVALAEDVAGMVGRRGGTRRWAGSDQPDHHAATSADATTSIRPPRKMAEPSNITASLACQVGHGPSPIGQCSPARTAALVSMDVSVGSRTGGR
jgi:2TM domain